jgi:hypothetical protein
VWFEVAPHLMNQYVTENHLSVHDKGSELNIAIIACFEKGKRHSPKRGCLRIM